jgi:hypothetical protein
MGNAFTFFMKKNTFKFLDFSVFAETELILKIKLKF